MSKYDQLGAHLRRLAADEIPMTFAEIEAVAGTALPPKAQNSRAWWSNNPSNNVMTKVWLSAGYETARVDMAARKLVFRRTVPSPSHSLASASTGFMENRHMFKPEALPEKKQGRHPLIGSMKGTFTLVPPSETEPPPEDPESWEALSLAKLDRLLFGKGE